MTLGHRELATFLSIARLGSIGSAAHALSITQPAVSRTIKKLEEQLGVPLFIRHSTGMELTNFGRTLRSYAELLETESGRVVEEIRLLNGAATGLARVGIVPSVAANLLPIAIQNALRSSPGIQVRVLEATGNQLASALVRGEIDFALGGLPLESGTENIHVTPLFEDEVCIVARANHPILQKSPMLLSDLYAYPWAIPEKGNVIWSGFQTIFRQAGMEAPPITVTANSVNTLKSIVSSTDFLTMLARVSIRIDEKHKILVALPIRDGRWRRQVGIMRRATGSILPAAHLVMAEISRLAKVLPEGLD